MYQQPDWQPQQSQKASACPKCGGAMIEARVPGYGDASAHLVSVDSVIGNALVGPIGIGLS